MFKRRLSSAATVFVLLMLLLAFAAPTFACLPPTPVPLELPLDIAPIVLIGTVVEVRHVDDFASIARVEVETYLQGTGPAVVEIFPLFHYVEGLCFSNLPSLGQRAMFFVEDVNEALSLDLQREGVVYSREELLFGIRPFSSTVYPLLDDTLSDAIAYINNPLRPYYQLERQIKTWSWDKGRGRVSTTIGLWALGFVGVLGVGFIIKRRLSNKPKAKHD